MTVVSDKASDLARPIVPLTTDADVAKSGITISRAGVKDPWGPLAKEWAEEEEEVSSEEVSSEEVTSEEELEEEVCSDSEEVRRRFGSMTFSDYDSAADGDFHPEEVCSEDSLEYCSETERTVAEDKLGAKEVGLDYTSAAASLAAELVACDRLLGAAAAVAPLPAIEAIRRQARAVRRAGEREAGACRPVRMLAERCQALASTLYITSILDMMGLQLQPVSMEKPKNPHWAEVDCEDVEPVRFCDLDLSSYDSDLDGDYLPSEGSEASEEELEWCSDVSEESEEESDN